MIRGLRFSLISFRRYSSLPSVPPTPIPQSNTTATPKTKKKSHYIEYKLDESQLEESFVRGRGPGGQSINKTKSCVQLVHIPTGTRVHCQEARDLTTNRKIARKLLRDKLDLLENGPASRLGRQIEKIRKRKAKTRSRQNKSGIAVVGSGGNENPLSVDSDDDSDSHD